MHHTRAEEEEDDDLDLASLEKYRVKRDPQSVEQIRSCRTRAKQRMDFHLKFYFNGKNF